TALVCLERCGLLRGSLLGGRLACGHRQPPLLCYAESKVCDRRRRVPAPQPPRNSSKTGASAFASTLCVWPSRVRRLAFGSTSATVPLCFSAATNRWTQGS